MKQNNNYYHSTNNTSSHHQQSQSSVHQVLQLIRSIKLDCSNQNNHTNRFHKDKDKQLSSLDFSSNSSYINNFSSIRTPLQNKYSDNNVFQRLYHQSKEKVQRKQLIQYQNRRSKQQLDKSQCTFSPNISISKISQKRQRTLENSQYDDDDSFYNKNMEWLQRKQKQIKLMQCQKNQQNHQSFSFTPKINKNKKFKQDQQEKKGVQNYYQRQLKAKNNKNFIEQRRKNPYSHVWIVKKGCFSNPYLR